MRIIAITTLLASLMAAAPAFAATFAEMETWCGPEAAGGRPVLCSTYLDAQLDGLRSTDPALHGGIRICASPTEDRDEIVRLLLAYAKANPQSRDLQAIDGVAQALKDRFPCR